MNRIISKIKQSKRISISTGTTSDNGVDHKDVDFSDDLQSVMNSSPSFTSFSLQLLDTNNCSSLVNQILPPASCTSENLEQDIGSSTSEFHDHLLRRKSRLSRTVRGTLSDPTALGYFLTYMESCGLRHLVKFWLDAETFKISSLATLKRLPANGRDNIMQIIESDAVAIFAKYLSKESSTNIGVTDLIRDETINKICCENGRLDPECFNKAQEFILNIMQTRYYPDYVKSVQYCKHLVEILSQDTVSITDILYDETALFNFIEFMEQDGQLNLVEFWLAAENFKDKFKILHETDQFCVSQAQQDAMVLYNKYLSLQSQVKITLVDDSQRSAVENEICSACGGPTIHCFDAINRRILAYLEQNYLPKFMRSKLFAKFYAELINTANSDLDLPNIHEVKRRTGNSSVGGACSSSDCSFSQQQTMSSELLFKAGCQKQRISSDQQSDTSSLNNFSDSKMADDDPDSLWKREKHKFALGHVDEAGRYISDAHNRPPSHNAPKRGKQLKEKVKKAVFGSREDEELIAEQVAAMIVQDVQNLTRISASIDAHFPVL